METVKKIKVKGNRGDRLEDRKTQLADQKVVA